MNGAAPAIDLSGIPKYANPVYFKGDKQTPGNQTVVSISGAGYVCITGFDTTTNSATPQINVDGTNMLPTIIVGAPFSLSNIRFETSFSVVIAGDGVNYQGVSGFYSLD